MTKDEAIRILYPETTAEALVEYEYYGGFNGKTAMVNAVSDACEVAVAALREKQTPVKLDRSRWKACHMCDSACPKYCPMCGRPLTEEAWAELERKIGGNDGTTD